MRNVLVVLALLVALFGVGQVKAADSVGNGPGTCMTVYNYTSADTTVTVSVPSGYPNSSWDIPKGKYFVLEDSSSTPIKSTSETNYKGGYWFLHFSPNDYLHTSFTYDSSRNRSIGCEGTWVATLTDN